MAVAGDGEIRCQENRTLSDDASRTGAAVGTKDGVRDIAGPGERAGPAETTAFP